MFQLFQFNEWFTKEGVDYYLETEEENRKISNGKSFWQLFMKFTEKHRLPANNLMVDIGCGPGIVASDFIKKFGFKELLAIDLSEPMLDCIPRYVDIQATKTTIQKADITRCQFMAEDFSADLALCCRTLPYTKSIENVLTESARVLKPGGLFGFNCLIHNQNKGSHFCEYAMYPMDAYAHPAQRIMELMKIYNFKLVEIDSGSEKGIASIPVNSEAFFFQKM